MNIEDWPELIMSFGPYAVLVLFALWIAPRQLKICRSLEPGFDKSLSGCIAGGAWLVVVSMVTYVVVNWTPNRVYDGTIGLLSENMEVIPIPHGKVDIYVKSNDVGTHSKKNIWGYALVTKNRIDESSCATFNVSWKDENNDYYEVDYEISLSDLITGQHTPISPPSPQHTNDRFVHHNGKWVNNAPCIETHQRSVGFFKTAYASDLSELRNISIQLQSNNKIKRGKARYRLRRLSNKDLHRLKSMVPNGSQALDVIRKIIAKNSR